MTDKTPVDWTDSEIGDYLATLTDYTANGSFASLKDNVTYYNAPNYACLVRTTDLEKRIFSPERFTDEKGFRFLAKSELKSGDIVVANVGSAGKAYRIPKYHRPMTLAPNMYLVAFKENLINSDFIFQVLIWDETISNLKKGLGSTTLSAINKSSFRSIPLLVPPLPEQQKIAAILTSVDEVIEKTQLQINKLQDLKKATMNDLLTKGIGHTEFKDSEIGRIPSNWTLNGLGEISKLERGKFSHRPRNDPRFFGGDYPFIQTGDVPKDSVFIDSYGQTLNELGYDVSKQFKKGCLVITIAANIGDVGMLNFDACFPDSLVGINVNRDIALPLYVLYALKNSKKDLEAMAPKTAQMNINLEKLNPFPIRIPPIDEQEKIIASLISIDEQIIIKTNKFNQLAALKKSLMQDLLTGKVRVKVD